jgi:cytochrome c553
MGAHSSMAHCTLLLVALVVAGCSVEPAPVADTAQQPEPPSPPAPQPSTPQISPTLPDASTTLVQKGERVATLLGCAGCHDKNLQGKVWEDEPEFAVMYTSNLTRALPHYNDEQLEHAIREGIRYDGSPLWEMPSEAFLPLSAPDMQALIAYLRSVPQGGDEHPRMVLGPEGEKEIEAGTFTSVPEAVERERHVAPVFAGEQFEWGRYLTHTICGECHGPDLRGNPKPETYRPDLVVAASYSLADFRTLLKTGQPTGNRTLKLMSIVAKSRLSHLTEDEVSAIHAYLVARAATPR